MGEPMLKVPHEQPKKRERQQQLQQQKKARQKKARREKQASVSFELENSKTPEEIEIEYLEAKLGIRGSGANLVALAPWCQV